MSEESAMLTATQSGRPGASGRELPINHHAPLATHLAVECRGVTKAFAAGEAQVLALRGVDLEVPAGEMTLLVGPSGCGKTTLISIVAGLLEPTAGQVNVLGENLTR